MRWHRSCMLGSLTQVATDSSQYCDCSDGWTSTSFHYTFHAWPVIWRKPVDAHTEVKLGGLNMRDKSGMLT